MEEVKNILKSQLDREKESIKRELTLSNLDAIYKITGALCNIHELECAEMPTVLSEASENLIKKYSNGKYDKNVDELYNRYILAKEAYKENGDQAHRDKLMECVGRLMVEVYDMLSSMVMDSDFADERKEIQKQIRKLADM